MNPERHPDLQDTLCAALEAELAACRRTAEDAEQQRDQLLAALAHDLRGPLNSICGWVQLLQGGRLDAQQQTRALESVARAAQAQTRLIETIGDLSNALRGTLQLAHERIELGALLRSILHARAAQSPATGANGDPGPTLCAEEPIWVVGDARRLRQLFEGLIDEAGRHVRHDRPLAVALRASGAVAWVHIHIGAPPSPAEQANRAAATGHPTRWSAALALGREIAALHGAGIVEMRADDAQHGFALSFEVSLPAVPAPDGPTNGPRRTELTARTPLHTPEKRDGGMRPRATADTLQPPA